VQILADDAPNTLEKGMAASLGVQIQAQPVAGPVSALTEEFRDESGRKISSIGDYTLKLLNRFIAPRIKEFEAVRADEMKRREVGAKFKFLKDALEEMLLKRQQLEQTIQSYQMKNEPNLIARTIFHAFWHKGQNIVMVVNDPEIQTALVLAGYGDKVIELAQAEYETLKEAYRVFEEKERVTLKALGLI
jgi:hypothetical protein